MALRQQHQLREQQHLHRLRQQNRQLQAQQEAFPSQQAGKVVDVVAAPGAAVKKGDPVVVLEIMKMETPVVAPQDGTVASVDVTKGETVESGAVLATMNA